MSGKAMIIGFLMAAGCLEGGAAQEITLSAASSLTSVLQEIAAEAQSFVGARVILNFGGSGALRRQIQEGAPVDLFFSASTVDMDTLEREHLILPESRRDLLRGSLVLIGEAGLIAGGGSEKPAGGAPDLRALVASADVIAIGDPDVVPAGRYAVEALKRYGLYDIASRKLALGATVREVLQFVQAGSAPLGIVFLTDALAARPEGSIVRIFQFPAETFSAPILYPIAVISASRNRAMARRLIEFLQGETARRTFARAGFELP